MSSDSRISDEMKRFVESIMTENNLQPVTCKIEYEVSAGSFEGFNSKPITVDITSGRNSLQLFVKEPLKLEIHENAPVDKLIANEIYFYKTVYPAYQDFLNERDVKSLFGNVPKCYGISGELIALENLKRKGFKLFGNQDVTGEDHIALTMKTLGRFHAISYAFKDQKRELYDSFIKNIQVCLGNIYRIGGFDSFIAVNNERFLKSLDPVADKNILDASDHLSERLKEALLNVDDYVSDYSTIIHGDCWCNNIMYKYEKDNQTNPTDIMLIDWQLLRHASPALELSYYFYTSSHGSALENLEYFLRIYHDELSKSMRRLGSDPDRLYPYAVLEEEWKKFAKFAFAIAFDVIRGLLLVDGEMASLEEYVENFKKTANAKGADVNSIAGIKNEHLYFARMKSLLKHFVQHGFL